MEDNVAVAYKNKHPSLFCLGIERVKSTSSITITKMSLKLYSFQVLRYCTGVLSHHVKFWFCLICRADVYKLKCLSETLIYYWVYKSMQPVGSGFRIHFYLLSYCLTFASFSLESVFSFEPRELFFSWYWVSQ